MSEAQNTYQTANANAEAIKSTHGITSDEYTEARLLENEAASDLLKWSHDLTAGRDDRVDSLYNLATRRPLVRKQLISMAMQVAA